MTDIKTRAIELSDQIIAWRRDLHQIPELFQNDLFQSPVAALHVRSRPLIDHRKSAVRIVAEFADLLSKLFLLRRELPDLFFMFFVPLRQLLFFPFGPGIVIKCHLYTPI